jgi:plasmid stability protein
MGSLTIPDFDDALKATLQERAARHGRSAEEEARAILRGALAPTAEGEGTERNLVEQIRAIFEPIGGLDLELPPREPARDPPDFS